MYIWVFHKGCVGKDDLKLFRYDDSKVKLSPLFIEYQECNARKVNCGRVYTLKPVLFGRNL